MADSLEANYKEFATSLPKSIADNINSMAGNDKLLDSYRRLASINSLKRDLIEGSFSKGAARFFHEAHNDALVSHVSASMGSWRAALQSLRSFMENTLSAVYYTDHPIEHIKWSNGEFKIAPKELRDYCSAHPCLTAIKKEYDFKNILDAEYATLSKAVHSSSDMFRMTDEGGASIIGKPSVSELGKWSTREKACFEVCLILIVARLSAHLDGAKLPNLRISLGHSIGKGARKALKSTLSITIREPSNTR